MKLLFVLDPLSSLKHYKDTSIAIMRAAHKRGHEVAACEQQDIFCLEGQVSARTRRLEISNAAHWYQEGADEEASLSTFDGVLMRKDPPVDIDYLATTHLLSLAEAQGASVFSRASGLRDFNEKLAIFRFPQFIAPTLVTASMQLVGDFLAEHGDVIVKPLHAMGGSGVFHLRPADPNRNSILETLTQHGSHAIMAQKYLPAIVHGDKRVLLINGEPIPYALARIPQAGETRGNLAAGGRGVAQNLSERDRQIAMAVGRLAREKGLFLVGLDIIGDCLTEINVTSPTGFVEITEQTGFDVADYFTAELETFCTG
ncbi:MAG: glutathione synthase [Thiobacillaceae bacterium]